MKLFKIISVVLILNLVLFSFCIDAFSENTEYESNALITYLQDLETVNAGRSKGYSEKNKIDIKDSHYGWKLGTFVINGYTEDSIDDEGPTLLKNVGDNITLFFSLQQDINALNGNDKLKIASDARGYDEGFQSEKTDFGKGALLVKDLSTGKVQIYRDYLNGVKKGANTKMCFLEEGDYEIALDYKTIETPVNFKIGKFNVVPTYNDYRLFFKLKIRNGNCMLFMFDTETGSELMNNSFTESGFRIDLANSKYLKTNVVWQVYNENNNSLDIRSNAPAKNGDEFNKEGIYTVSVENTSTNKITKKSIYVGNDELLKAYLVTGLPFDTIKSNLENGDMVEYNGTIVSPVFLKNNDLDNNDTEIKVPDTSKPLITKITANKTFLVSVSAAALLLIITIILAIKFRKQAKKIIAVFLVLIIALSSFSALKIKKELAAESDIDIDINDDSTNVTADCVKYEAPTYMGMGDPMLLQDLEEDVYSTVLDGVESDKYFVQNVSSVYVSQEYIDEVIYNSKENEYFGYTLSELDKQYKGERYVFMPDEEGNTIVKPLKKYDDALEKVIKDVAIGTGVILLCVTLSAVTGGTSNLAAVNMIFAVAAKGSVGFGGAGAVIGAVANASIKAFETKDFKETMKAAAVGAAKGFKIGAITGALAAGGAEAIGLKGAVLNGLTMNNAALIQKETKWPLKIIKSLHSMDEYNALKLANLSPMKINGKWALTTKIDFDLVDENGLTNIQRIKKNLVPIDKYGNKIELHHIGQRTDTPLAMLSSDLHDKFSKVLHYANEGKGLTTAEWNKIRNKFWKDYLKLMKGI